MGLFSRKKAAAEKVSLQAPPNHASEAWTELAVADEGQSSLTDRVFGLFRATGLAYVVSGPGSIDDCLAEVVSRVPAAKYSTVLPHGIGWFANMVDKVALAALDSPSGSAALICALPAADLSDVDELVQQPLRRISRPWFFDSASRGRGPASVISLVSQTRAVPLWDISTLQVAGA